jgi:proteasome lid subunit RPN8/RPN11
VFYDEVAVAEAARAARPQRLGIVATVHTHPGDDTRHSDGDDDLALMPYEGMFSLVIARYGHGSLQPEHGAGLHQYQDGNWVQIDQDDPPLLIVPDRLS